TLACWRSALLLVRDVRGAYAVLVRGPNPHDEPSLQLEVAGLETVAAQQVQRELAELRAQLNVYRGQVLELVQGRQGLTVAFPDLPPTAREDVVLPEPVLRRIERHTVDVADRREQLRAAGQHLKRGLLLYGPPGTGKTHTTRYVVQRLAGCTVLLLSGRALHQIAMVTALARELQPAVVVLEDVDLVAEDRSYGPGPSPVLFELLDAMDGSAADADLLFLLTTNRADLLEPALAARPGRVDVAVEIALPDEAARRRLFEVYARGVPLQVSTADVEAVVERTEGVTASFIKELVRRGVLEALSEQPGDLQTVTGAHLARAMDDLLDSSQGVTRALLGVPADQSGPASAPPPGEGHARPGVAWLGGSYR
ncbi:MAG: ATP-binding protein, partial [Frankiales bacterium]|nr:ATP-binding protein [Frankiales bacterium]